MWNWIDLTIYIVRRSSHKPGLGKQTVNSPALGEPALEWHTDGLEWQTPLKFGQQMLFQTGCQTVRMHGSNARTGKSLRLQTSLENCLLFSSLVLFSCSCNKTYNMPALCTLVLNWLHVPLLFQDTCSILDFQTACTFITLTLALTPALRYISLRILQFSFPVPLLWI